MEYQCNKELIMLSRILSSASSGPDERIQSKHKIAEGILAINVLSCSLPSYLELPKEPVLEVCIAEKKKSTSLCFQEGNEIGTDNSKKIFHFQVEVPHCALSRCNLLSVQLLQGTEVLGTLYLHLHDIIRDTPLQGKMDIRAQGGEVVAQICVAVAFTYGLFGYSESYHLEDFPSVGSYTLFPRIESQDERFNHAGRVLNPKPTNPIHLIPSTHLPGDPSPKPQPSQFPLLSASVLSDVRRYRELLDKTDSRLEKIDLLKKWLTDA